MKPIDRSQLRAPARVLDVELNSDDDGDIDLTLYMTAWCLVRNDGTAVAASFLDVEDVSMTTLGAVREVLARLVDSTAIETPRAIDSSLTVVICTRDRPQGLHQTLKSLVSQSDTKFNVLVVDNSRDGGVARTLTHFEGLALKCCHEPRPGLSRARNCALAEVDADLIAWLDDDEEADPDWVAWIKRGFGSPQRPAAVAGVMLPAELETPAQVQFESYGGFNKGRGMQPEILRVGTPSVFDPLYPLPSFGAGGNMAFRTETLRSIGGFDDRLGAGTLTHGGEETKALALVLETGATVLHWPPAVTWHYHRRTDEELEKQFYGYSAGLTAFFMSMILSSPKYLWRILGFLPRGMKRLAAQRSHDSPDSPPVDFPQRLLRAGRRGLTEGAWMYLREGWRQGRARQRSDG